MWIITNIESLKFKPENFLKFENYKYYSDELLPLADNSSRSIFFTSGHYIISKSCNKLLSGNNQRTLDNVYKFYANNFIQYIKGNFIILQLSQSSFRVYSDRFAIKKFFYWHNGNKFIISDRIIGISRNVKVIPSQRNIVIYSLTYHFIGGTTLFEGVKHNTPAQIIEYKSGELNFSNYWNPSELLHNSKAKVGISELSDCLEKVVGDLLEIQDGKISLSLTGGADTRNLLAVFLRKGIRPHLYTYGNPRSADCIKAKTIASGLGLEHSIYDIKMDADLFEQYSRKIVRSSGGLASIHRVHRLMAVEMEACISNSMFLGTLGGEFIKGVSEDNYIVPSIVYDNWKSQKLLITDICYYLNQKKIFLNEIYLKDTLDFLNSEPYFSGNSVNRKMNALAYLTAHLHDAQDVNLYNTVMDEVYTPYLDIDYLNVVFSSFYSFDRKELINNKILKRIDNPVYASKFLKVTYRSLLKFEYCGEHKPAEVLFNKYYGAIAKYIRQSIRPKYPQNFPLGSWMEDFVERHLPICENNEIINATFDIHSLMNDFRTSQHVPNEWYWLKYTNPIMMRFIIEEFK